MKHVPAFLASDSGAVTVDWTVLAAAVVGLGVASVGAVRSGVGTLGGDIEGSLSSASVVTLGALGSSGVQAGYSLKYYSPEEHQFNIASIEFWSDQTLLTMIPSYTENISQYIADGDGFSAGMNMDELYALHVTAQSRGLDWPSGAATISELDAAYAARFD